MKYKSDIAAIENYYDNKWTDEFNGMRTNLQSKYNHKEEKLEREYKDKLK